MMHGWNSSCRHPGLDPGSRLLPNAAMDQIRKGGWVYIMANRYRGTMYVGVTSDLATRVHQHKCGLGSDFCMRYNLHRLVWAEQGENIEDCIVHEKRVKRWARAWKFALIERGNPDWADLYATII
jgi:putative endonuclease